MAEEHPLKPFYSVLVLAFACSALVALAAVGLRPYQEANQALDKKKNILAAAGIYEQGVDVEAQFASIETRLVDLDNGAFVQDTAIDPDTYDQLAASMRADTGAELGKDEDLAGIKRREKYSLVYLVKDGDKVDQLVLPVRGKGLWSTMYGYVAIDADLSTIRGVSFYEHGETPGLGGEIENPRWQQGWQDKQLYNNTGDLAVVVAKSGSQKNPANEAYQIDGLSGATLTTQGVNDMMQFWFGEHGFEPFFEQIRTSGGFNG
jgi:Na+-transporting NADH:ubiquinone oxidoreductase subunit C